MIDFIDQRWLPNLVVGGSLVVVAVAGGALTEVGAWYEGLRFPSWRPPNWLFAPAWTLIYLFIYFAAVKGWERADTSGLRAAMIGLFAANALINIAWSALFFKLRRPDWALADVSALWVSVLALVLFFAAFAPVSAWLLAPYLAWVSFAAFLNFTMVRLNRPFRTQRG